MQIADSTAASSAFSAGLTGVQRHLRSFDKTVEKISQSGTLQDLPQDLVDLTLSQRGAQASMVTIRAADEMVGTLLDVLA